MQIYSYWFKSYFGKEVMRERLKFNPAVMELSRLQGQVTFTSSNEIEFGRYFMPYKGQTVIPILSISIIIPPLLLLLLLTELIPLDLLLIIVVIFTIIMVVGVYLVFRSERKRRGL